MSERRPRIDSVMKAIEEGRYDDEIAELQEALIQRRAVLFDDLNKKIKELLGPEFQIVHQQPTDLSRLAPPKKPSDTIVIGGKSYEKRQLMNLVQTGDKNYRQDFKPVQDGGLLPTPPELDQKPLAAEKPEEAPLVGEDESRSPMFGAVGEDFPEDTPPGMMLIGGEEFLPATDLTEGEINV